MRVYNRNIFWGCLVSFCLTLLPAQAQGEGEEERLYARFDQAVRTGDFEQARQTGAAFIEAYPDSANLLRVEYWLGCIEPDYEQAVERLEAVIEKTKDSRWAVLAGTRIAERARLARREKDAIDALRDVERKARSDRAADPTVMTLPRLEMARGYLSLGRESAASTVLDRLKEPEELSKEEQQSYWFSRAAVLWQRGRKKEFWRQVLEFESRFPESDYLPSLRWIAAGYPTGGKSRRGKKVDREMLQDIVEYFPGSPEAYLARKALRSM